MAEEIMNEDYITKIMGSFCLTFEGMMGDNSDEVLMFSIKDERALCSCDMSMAKVIEFMKAFIECNERNN